MPLKIIRNDILKMNVDAIVNPTDYRLSGSGSIDKKIHDAGGEKLRAECAEYNHCDFGDAIITNAYNLSCKYIIHTVSPFWRDNPDDLKTMKSCYLNCLRLAKEMNLESIAFPLIGTGSFRIPKDLAIDTAISAINSFLLKNEMKVYLVVYTSDAFEIVSMLVEDIKSYINDDDINCDFENQKLLNIDIKKSLAFYEYRNIPLHPSELGSTYISKSIEPKTIINDIISPTSLDDIGKNKDFLSKLDDLDDSFSSKYLRYIDELGFDDVEVYKAASISKQVFQRVKNNEKISKKTAIALCMTLPLKYNEFIELLNTAGYSLSNSDKFDKCIKLILKRLEGRKTLLDISKVDYTLYELNVETFGK